LSEDPRRVLEEAARQRLSCEVLPRRGSWCQGRFVRVEKAGVVLVVDAVDFTGGEDVRVWFTLEHQPWTFEASVLRAGVPVPDRSQHGLMLGFIDSWERGEPIEETAPGLGITVLPPNGRGLELLSGGVRLVDLGVDALSFAVPRAEALKFVEVGVVRLRFRQPGGDHLVNGLVRKLAPGDAHYLYEIRFVEVADPGAHPVVVEAFRGVITR
jgi:hypothetical protein